MGEREQFEAWWKTTGRALCGCSLVPDHTSPNQVFAARGFGAGFAAGFEAARAQPAQAGQVLTDEEVLACIPTVTLKGEKPVPMVWLKQADAIQAMRQIESAVLAKLSVRGPVAWAVYWGLPPTRKNSVHFDKESAQAVANQIKSATEVRPLYATPVAQQPQADTPQATTIAEAARDVGKWLNERPNRPIDLRHVAMLVAHAMQPQAEPHKPLFADLIAQHPGLREELLELREELLEMDEPQADSIPVAAFDRLMALCESQAQRIIELEDKQPQAEAVPSDAMVMAGARALCNRFADTGGVSADDQWAIYSEDFKDDARAVLVAAIKQGGRV